MRIEETVVSGWATCSRDRRSFGSCAGYASREVPLLRETRTITFGDLHKNVSDPYFPITSHEHVTLRPVHEEDWKCAFCGAVANLSLEPRAEFARMSETGPEEIVRKAELERARDQRSADALDAGERQAIALEKLAASADASRASELQELHAGIEQLRALIAANGNGHGEADKSMADLPTTSDDKSRPTPAPTSDAPSRPRKRTP